MADKPNEKEAGLPTTTPDTTAADGRAKRRFNWKAMLGSKNEERGRRNGDSGNTSDAEHMEEKKPAKWAMGMLNDSQTDEVPGSVLLLSGVYNHNAPLGTQHEIARRSSSSFPPQYPPSRSSSIQPSRQQSIQIQPSRHQSIHHSRQQSIQQAHQRSIQHSRQQSRRKSSVPDKKLTADGQIVLEPQPDDSLNDPLNWTMWRRDSALMSLGFYCMLGGGMTPVLAAGFNNVAHTYHVSEPDVALTTGLYMLGLGVGSVVLSPTAILYGKRPVYLAAALCFALSAVWCALSPSFGSLVAARIFMGVAVSSVECLPSATVAEIYFLHEKAYRLGIYTLLMLSGKNLVPLVSAAIMQSLGWRWVFWITAMVVAFAGILLFFFVPETFWDRTPLPRKPRKHRFRSNGSLHQIWKSFGHSQPASPGAERKHKPVLSPVLSPTEQHPNDGDQTDTETRPPSRHAHFQEPSPSSEEAGSGDASGDAGDEKDDKDTTEDDQDLKIDVDPDPIETEPPKAPNPTPAYGLPPRGDSAVDGYFAGHDMTPATDKVDKAQEQQQQEQTGVSGQDVSSSHLEAQMPSLPGLPLSKTTTNNSFETYDPRNAYTRHFVSVPPKSKFDLLRPWSGRLCHETWWRVALRPFILFAYPSILWSTLVYSLSIGWLIVLSESVTTIYKSKHTYNFTSLQAGLIYISPFVGGVLGTAVAGKVSDAVVRYLSRKNGGIYEPEFRLTMAIPIAVTTVIGLMGYGWSVEEHDAWIVPTIFFGVISFGCSLGSTTSITFAVDSYRQYAGEALVTLNFSKNIFHGLVFSLFFNEWLDSDGSKKVFVAIGGMQLAFLLTTIPMYIYGKRARMWTVRKNLMGNFEGS